MGDAEIRIENETLGGLADVEAASPSDDQALTWDDTLQKWVPETISGVTPAPHESTHIDGGSDEVDSALDPRAYPLLAGLAANRPTVGVAGRSYYSTDTLVLERDNGTSWVEVARGETATRLAQLSEKAHGSLTGVGASDHHAQSHKDDHDPEDGGDKLDCAAPGTNITPEQTNAEGSAHTFARSDHMHYIPSGAPSTVAAANSEGTGAAFARQDHVHQREHAKYTDAAAKAAAIAGWTASRALQVDAGGGIEVSPITLAELNYLDGVTSALQTQLDAKVAKALFDAQSILAAVTDNNPVALAIAEDRLLGRRTGQNIEAISPANVWAFLSAHAAAAVSMNDKTLTALAGMLATAETELTIAAGVITVTQMRHKVDTAGDAASDDLDTINGGTTVNLIILRAENDARTVVVKHGTGNIWLQGKADISLDDLEDGIMLAWDSTNSKWFDIAAGGAGVAAHAILDGSVHNDSVADAVTRGSLIYGNSTPKWDELVKGAADTVLGSDGTDVMYRTMAQLWASLSGDAAAAVDMNGQFFSDMPMENGATVPASPRTGEMFLHTPTGRKILMMYDGSNWIPIISIGAMTVYVDATDGSDDIDKGTGVDANAFATVQYAIDQIPPIFNGDVTINVNDEAYAETVTVKGKNPGGNYIIKLQGTLSQQETATGDSKVQGVTITRGTLTDTGAFTGDSYANMLFYTAGEAIYRLIDSHTNDVVTICGTFTNTTDLTWTVYDWGTSINRITISPNQKAVRVYDITFPGDGSFGIYLDHFSESEFYRCKVTHLVRNIGGYVIFDTCYLRYDTGQALQTSEQSRQTFYRSKVMCANNTGRPIYAYSHAFINITAGTILDGDAGGGNKATYGLWYLLGAIAIMWCANADGDNIIRNCDTGIDASLNAAVRTWGDVTFTNCTADTNTATGGQIQDS